MGDEGFKIHVTKILPEMVLSKDIVTGDGEVIIPGGRALNYADIDNLRALGVEYITVRPSAPKKLIKAHQAPNIVEKVEFKSFEHEYETRAEQYKTLVHDIGAGRNIDISELYRLTDGIIRNMKFKNDVFTFVSFIKQSEGHVFSHCINVSILCHIFAGWLKLRPKMVLELTVAGILHDIGMTKLSPELLNKSSPLSVNEFERVKEHTLDGYRLLADQAIPDAVKAAVLMHHERMDGKGYPMGVGAKKLNAYAKIVSICDKYDAMTSDRPYRERMSPFKVIRILETGMYGELDAYYLLFFLQRIAYNYLGSWVRLSDGRAGEIMFINRLNVSKPIVRTEDDEMIDLATSQGLSIESLV